VAVDEVDVAADRLVEEPEHAPLRMVLGRGLQRGGEVFASAIRVKVPGVVCGSRGTHSGFG